MSKTFSITMIPAPIYHPSLQAALDETLVPFAIAQETPFAISTPVSVGSEPRRAESTSQAWAMMRRDDGIVVQDLYKAPDDLRKRCAHAAFASIGDNACWDAMRAHLPTPSLRFTDTTYDAVFLRHGLLLMLSDDFPSQMYDAAEAINYGEPVLSQDIVSDAFMVFMPKTISNHARFELTQEASAVIRRTLHQALAQRHNSVINAFFADVEIEVRA